MRLHEVTKYKKTKVNYEFIEHTADVGIRVKAGDLKGIFKNAALAMFDIVAEKRTENREQRTENSREIIVKQKANDLKELFVNWLNDLLSLSAVKGLIFCDFKINKIDEGNLQAVAAAEAIKNYKVNVEIKAATYHQLKLEETKGGWQAEVIFDV